MSDVDPQSALFHCLNAPATGRVLFVGALPGADLPKDAVLVQPLQPEAGALKVQGRNVATDIPEGSFDHALMLVSKNHDETRALMARALVSLKAGGTMTVAGANDAGGKRIEKDFTALGLSFVSDSKHKSRVVQARKTADVSPVAQEWIAQGDWQPILDGSFVSRPGLFSWDRIDKGSELLAAHIPQDLKGRGADFGCGYGYLSAQVLLQCAGVEHITALDADARAVEACARNAKFSEKIETVWHDLTQPPALLNLDFIVMNPPFHEGVSTHNQLGITFIRNAAACLKSGGQLYMVANNHLPYEDVLKDLFRTVQEIGKDKGFKILRAKK